MKLHYKGKYDLNPESLPHGEHVPGATQFREVDDTKKLGLYANLAAFLMIVVLSVAGYFRAGLFFAKSGSTIGILAAIFALFPHEFLHAVCFKEDVYLYTNWKQGMLFVVGTESMSKGRFILMSMLPNLVFGVMPFAVGMIFPQYIVLLNMGVIGIAMGCGDYYNVINALRQMPKGSRTYLYGFHSYWYLPEKE